MRSIMSPCKEALEVGFAWLSRSAWQRPVRAETGDNSMRLSVDVSRVAGVRTDETHTVPQGEKLLAGRVFCLPSAAPSTASEGAAVTLTPPA